MPHAAVTFVLATHNRGAVVLDTLANLAKVNAAGPDSEVVVVDNASSDGAADEIARCHPAVRLVRRSDNRGSCAKAFGVEAARGEFIVFLDDDSCPRPGSIGRMIEHFRADSRLAAAGFSVHLPDGRMESAALPDVFVGCGVSFRAATLRAVGGLDAGFFMQAEEYDLAFRLVAAGHRIAVFDDLHVDHLKSPSARCSARTSFYDTRNNLIVAARYLPAPYERIYRRDWLQRYRWIAQNEGMESAFWRGAALGLMRRDRERRRFCAQRLNDAAFDRLFRVGEIDDRMKSLAERGVRRIALVSLGKNVYPFVAAARAHGIAIAAIVDDRFARPGRRYRGVPLVPAGALRRIDIDRLVVADTGPAHAAAARDRLGAVSNRPIEAWFTPSPPPVANGEMLADARRVAGTLVAQLGLLRQTVQDDGLERASNAPREDRGANRRCDGDRTRDFSRSGTRV